MKVARTLEGVAERLVALSREIEAGNAIEPEALRIEARRICAQLEALEQGLAE